MHSFLRSIGFDLKSKKQLKELISWVIDTPDSFTIHPLPNDSNVSQARRKVAPGLGVAVCGELNEQGVLIPEYYYPYCTSREISSTAKITYMKQAGRDAYSGMSEDFHMGVAIIYFINNHMDIRRLEDKNPFGPTPVSVSFSGLAQSGSILLPLKKTPEEASLSHRQFESRAKLLESAHEGDVEAAETLTQADMNLLQSVNEMVSRRDIYSVVDSFFFPSGMECDQYSLMGDIQEVDDLMNERTGLELWKLRILCNQIPMTIVINKFDLLGIPKVGHRFKGSIWLMGDVHFKEK